MARKFGSGKNLVDVTGGRKTGSMRLTAFGPAVTRPQARQVSNYPAMPMRPLGRPMGPVMGPIQGSPAVNPFPAGGALPMRRGPFRGR